MTLFLSLLVGFVAGIIGELVFNAYLLDNGSPLMQLLGQNSVVQSPSTSRTRSTQQLATTVESVNKTVLAIYPIREGTTPADQAYPPEAQTGSALLLTDDGWAVTTDTALSGGGTFVAVTAERKVLKIQHVVADSASSLLFFKIDGTNYPVISLSTGEAIVGEPFYALAGGARQVLARVQETQIEDRFVLSHGVIESSDVVDRLHVIAASFPVQFRGGALMNVRGEIAGVLLTDGETSTAVPVQVLSTALRSLLSKSVVVRPYLGIRYIDIASTPGVADAFHALRNDGALVTGTEDNPAVVPLSPAATAGIRDGDLLVRVDNQTLGEEASLSVLLQAYSPGDLVTLQLLRDGKEENIRVTLGERPSR